MTLRIRNRKVSWATLLLLAVGALCSSQILKSVLAGPALSPRQGDRVLARREVKPAAGADERGSSLGAAAETLRIVGNGIVEPAQRETKLASDVSGRIAEVLVREGERVAEGAVLVRLTSSSEQAALAAAVADVRAAKAEYQRVSRGQRQEDIEAAIADADAAESKAELSAGVLKRNAQLAKTGALTADELDRLQRQAATDRSMYRQSDARRRAALHGARKEDIAAARARLDAAIARKEQARAALDRLAVRAPIAGEILQIKHRVGEYYTPSSGDALLIIGDTRELQVRMDVDERDIAAVGPGAHAEITADAFKGQHYRGVVVEVGRRMGRKNIRTDDPTERIDTKILEVVIRLDEPGRLLPGLRVVGYLAPVQAASARTVSDAR